MRWLLLLFGLLTAALPAQDAANVPLRANDQIEVTVFQEPDLTRRVHVGQDGSITLPLIGTVRVGGQAVATAERRIAAAYEDGYLVSPQVTVSVVAYARREVSVLGQVGRPGPVLLKPGESLSLVAAISQAGGFTRIANQRKVKVTRNGRVQTFNVRDLSAGTAAMAYLQEGDIVTVEESLF
jgi:polysaccharide biosynthesis/export protein